jgi:hypothetical protein
LMTSASGRRPSTGCSITTSATRCSSSGWRRRRRRESGRAEERLHRADPVEDARARSAFTWQYDADDLELDSSQQRKSAAGKNVRRSTRVGSFVAVHRHHRGPARTRREAGRIPSRRSMRASSTSPSRRWTSTCRTATRSPISSASTS